MLRALERGLAASVLAAGLVAALPSQLQDIPAPGAMPAGTAESPALVMHIDFDAFRRGMESSRIRACWSDPLVAAWRETVFAPWLAGMQRGSPVDQQALLASLTGDAAILIAPEAPTAAGRQRFGSAMAFRQPGRIASFEQVMQPAITEQAQGRLDYAIRVGEDMLVIGNASAATKDALAGQLSWGAIGLGLSEPPGSFVSGRLDYGAMFAQLRAAGQMPDALDALLFDLGLSQLGALEFSARFSGTGGLVTEVEMDLTEDRSGLLNQLGGDAPFRCLAAMPPGSLFSAALRLAPPDEAFRWFETMLARHSVNAEQQAQEIEAAIQGLREATGLDFRQEVLPALGQEVGFTFGGMSALAVDLAFFLEVRDAATIQRLIDGLLARANEQATAQGRPPLQPSPFMAGTLQAQVITLPTFPGQLCYAFSGAHLIVTTSATEMTAIGQALASGQSLAQTAEFQEVFGGEAPLGAAFTFRDTARLLQGLLQLAAPILAERGAQVPPDLAALLGQIPQLVQHTGPRGMVLSAQEQRVSLRSVNASGAEYLLLWMLALTSAQSPSALPDTAAPASPEVAAAASPEAPLLSLPEDAATPAAPADPAPASPELGGALLNLPPPPAP